MMMLMELSEFPGATYFAIVGSIRLKRSVRYHGGKYVIMVTERLQELHS
jgi:hypothetical protein